MEISLMHHSTKPWLTGLDPEFFNTYLDFLLGEHVWGLVAKNAAGNTVAAPTWGQVLTFELEIRKKACSIVIESRGATTLMKAWKAGTCM